MRHYPGGRSGFPATLEEPTLRSLTAKTGLAALLLMAVLVGVETVPLAVIATEWMDELNSRFELIMDETMAYLDQAWEVAKRFRDPEYDFQPSDLGNFTIPELPGTG